jgi:hypothetical protein
MTPQERDLIQGVAQRLRSTPVTDKDSEADRFIQGEIGSNKDALYLLTQAVIVQEQGLKHAQDRIRHLETDLQAARQQAPAPAKSGGFLGGLFGSHPAQSPPPPQPPAYAPPQPPAYAQPMPAAAAPGGGSGVGSFLKTAAAAAAGAAGGALIYDGLKNMFGGAFGGMPYGGMPLGGGGFLGSGPAIIEENVTNVYNDPSRGGLLGGTAGSPGYGGGTSGGDFGDPDAAGGTSGGDFGSDDSGSTSGGDVGDSRDQNLTSGGDYGTDEDDDTSGGDFGDDEDDDDNYGDDGSF